MGPLSRCPDARTLLPAYVEGELSAPEHRRLAGHLALCAACRREEAQYRQALGLLNAPRERFAPGDLYAGFAAKLERSQARVRRRQQQLRWAVSTACLLLVGGVAAQQAWTRLNPPPAPHPAPTPLVMESPAPPRRETPLPQMAEKSPKWQTAQEVLNAASDPFAPPVGPKNPAPSEVRSPAPVDAPRRVKQQAAMDFWHVRDQRGRSLADWQRLAQRDRARARAASDPGAMERAERMNQRRMPQVEALDARHDERVQVGDSVTHIHTEAVYSPEGRPILVNVNIGTTNQRTKEDN